MKKDVITIGIDPGAKGGIGRLGGGPAWFRRLDTKDAPAVYSAIGDALDEMWGFEIRAAVEQVTGASMGKAWKKIDCDRCGGQQQVEVAQRGMFAFGESVGVVKGVLASLEIPFIEVGPRKWQNAELGMGVVSGKKRTEKESIYLKRARERWPEAGLKYKADAGGAAGLFLASYARSRWP